MRRDVNPMVLMKVYITSLAKLQLCRKVRHSYCRTESRLGGSGRRPAEEEAEREEQLKVIRRQRKAKLKQKKSEQLKERKKLKARIMLKAAHLRPPR